MFALRYSADRHPDVDDTIDTSTPISLSSRSTRIPSSHRRSTSGSSDSPPSASPVSRLRTHRLGTDSLRSRTSGPPAIRTGFPSSTMSRPTQLTRPTHIPLPTSPVIARGPNSPTGSSFGTQMNGRLSPTSPRNSFLPSFMRPRSRAATMTTMTRGATSPSIEVNDPLGTPAVRAGSPPNRATASREAGVVTRSVSTPAAAGLVNGISTGAPVSGASTLLTSTQPLAQESTLDPQRTYRIRLVPHLETSRSLAFDPVVRELLPIVVPSGISPSIAAASVTAVGPTVNGRLPALILKIGRFTDKLPAPTGLSTSGAGDNEGASASSGGVPQGPGIVGGAAMTIAGGGGDITSSKVAFKSKVVSRSHAEIWCENGGKFYIRDTASSSGTFLNHIRLSSPNSESRQAMINDGDILQLGVDYQGGLEDMFRSVKMRVELGREWQRGANEFNTNALKQLKALGGVGPESKGKAADLIGTAASRKGKSSVTDCCICLFSVTVCQSLFIAPCSHVFHYKCIRPLLAQHHPGFSCPLCRTFANLEEDVETEDAWEIASRRASIISHRPSNHSIRFPMHEDSPDDALVGTGSGLGASSASIDELLGGESRTASEEGVMPGFSALARQVTAVQEGGAREAGDMDMPQALYEEDEPSQEQPVLIQEREDDDGGGISPGWDDNPDLSSSLAILTDPTMLDRAYSYSGSTPSTDHAAVDVVSPSAANPRPAQYTFLSTTARSPPINHNGMNGHRNAAEDGTGEDVAGDGMEVEPQPIREGMRPREFIDMMFT